MTEIASRELRNDTAGVLRRVEAGESLTVMSNGRPVAQLVPLPRKRRSGMSRAELIGLVREAQADPGLRDDLRELAGETTDDLGPIR
jgi:prevent-host-death family protein